MSGAAGNARAPLAATGEARRSNGCAAGTTQTAAPPDPLTAALASMLRPLVRQAVAEALAEHEHGAAPIPALLTVDQVCASLQISRASLHRLRLEGLPVVMVLDSPRFRLDDVLQWLDQRTRQRQDPEHG